VQPLSSDNPEHFHPSSNPEAPLGRLDLIRKSVGLGFRLLRGLRQFSHLSSADPKDAVLLKKQAAHLQALCSGLLQQLGIVLQISGKVPEAGFLVSNHIGFTDILVLGAIQPTVFVSKFEVSTWPLVGSIAANAGTIFIQRQRRSDVARVNIDLKRAIDSQVLVTLFPEGTSSDGRTILPFLPSLLQPAIEANAPVTPAFLQYTDACAQRVDEVAYFGDRHLKDCMWALIKRRQTFAKIHFGEPITPSGDRKTLAALLFDKVQKLAACEATRP
jgi:1-acyl-sn-glycerol-3-phosphate acyltransferase